MVNRPEWSSIGTRSEREVGMLDGLDHVHRFREKERHASKEAYGGVRWQSEEKEEEELGGWENRKNERGSAAE